MYFIINSLQFPPIKNQHNFLFFQTKIFGLLSEVDILYEFVLVMGVSIFNLENVLSRNDLCHDVVIFDAFLCNALGFIQQVAAFGDPVGM